MSESDKVDRRRICAILSFQMGKEEQTLFAKERVRLLIGVAGLGAFLLGVGVLGVLALARGDWKGMEEVRELQEEKEGTQGKEAGEDKSGKTIVVDIGGAVERPGIYELQGGARVNDALIAAGGLSVEADRVWVTRNINLAQKVSDGNKIFIPFKIAQGGQVGVVLSSQNTVQQQTVSINTATATELEALWGIGEARAKAIIEGRPYSSIEELVTKKIVPQSVVEKNKEKLTL